MIVFSHLTLNGCALSLGSINKCETFQKDGRNLLILALNDTDRLELDIQKSIAEFNYSEWNADAVAFDFKLSLAAVPPWLQIYSKALAGCGHKIAATMKATCSQSKYRDFTNFLRAILSPTQCNRLGKVKEEAKSMWDQRQVARPNRIVKSVNFLLPNFVHFRLEDVERLKNDGSWLSDSHVTLAVQHFFRESGGKDARGGLKINLLDTAFWSELSADPEKFSPRYRSRVKILECDLAVMPMYGDNHWRLGIIEKPGQFLQGRCTFHILDSLRVTFPARKELKQLQNILLEHFEEESFLDGRISVSVPEVPLQSNTVDCACFAIYFAKKFLQNPDSAFALIKKRFSSASERLAAWGLENTNVAFVRRELRTLLFKYISSGEAVVEYL